MSATLPKRQHFGELDSIRGLAALVVVFHHFVLLSSPTSYSKFLLHVVANGHSAVMMFFVLSGFVLSLPILRGDNQPYLAYLTRRVCRIYLPYLAALSIALVCDAIFHNRPLASPFVANSWSVPVSLKLIAQHVAFIGDYDYFQVNPAFWSLVHEMRISLIFPVFCLALYRLRFASALALLGALTGLGTVLTLRMPAEARTFVTLHYLAIFGLGALLARHLSLITAWYDAAGRTIKYAAALAGTLLYVSRTESMASKVGCLADIPVALGAILLVVLSLNSNTIGGLLSYRLSKFLGGISYSLYLVHVTVLFVLLRFFANSRPVFLVLYLTVAIACAYALWGFVEKPSIQLGKTLSQKVRKIWTANPRGTHLAESPSINPDSQKDDAVPRPELLTT